MEHTQKWCHPKGEEVVALITASMSHWLGTVLEMLTSHPIPPLLPVKAPQAKRHRCLPQEARGVYGKDAGDVGHLPTPATAPVQHP